MKALQVPSKVDLVIRIVVAVIILQTLRFKFLGAEESVLLFSQVSNFVVGDNSLEALMRIGTGSIELIAGILLLIRPLALYGALLTAGTMIGAIKTHVFIIGIAFNGDGGLLFGVAILALLGSLAVIVSRLSQIPLIGKRFEESPKIIEEAVA